MESLQHIHVLGTHAWLECANLIIDITADQFPGIKEKILVTRENSWYEQFEKNSQIEKYDFLNIKSADEKKRIDLYNNIVRSGVLVYSAKVIV